MDKWLQVFAPVAITILLAADRWIRRREQKEQLAQWIAQGPPSLQTQLNNFDERMKRQDAEISRLHKKASDMWSTMQATIGKVDIHLAEARILDRRKASRD